MDYTERIEGFQVRDCVYLHDPPPDRPLRLDVVKWYKLDTPQYNEDIATGKTSWRYDACYSVGSFVWNAHEGCFKFDSVGTRWLDAHPSKAVENRLIEFISDLESWLLHQDIKSEEVTHALLPRIHREFSGSAG